MSNSSFFQKCDFHIHSNRSPCAKSEMSVGSIVGACREQRIGLVGISDHIFSFTDTRILAQTRTELAEIEAPPKLFLGCEADVLDVGKHLVTEEMKSSLDFIAVSANHFHVDSVSAPPEGDARAAALHMLDMFRYACSLDFVDIVVHPMMIVAGPWDPNCMELLTDDEINDALKLARQNDVAIELSPRSLAPEQYEFRLRFLSLCRDKGLKFSIGSDAHHLCSIGRTDALEPLIRELGIGADEIWLPSACKGLGETTEFSGRAAELK